MSLDELKLFFAHGGICPYLAVLLAAGAFAVGCVAVVVRTRVLRVVAASNVLLVAVVGWAGSLVADREASVEAMRASPVLKSEAYALGLSEAALQWKYGLILAIVAAVPVVVALAMGPKDASGPAR